jgi:histidine triad (HIT) family protein
MLRVLAARRMVGSCVFCRIVSREAPAAVLREDERFIVFPDISPAAAHHLLVVPKVEAGAG